MQTKLVSKLGQRLTMTPQLSLSLKILAMNSIELDIYVKQCMENNPLIEAEGPAEDVDAETIPEVIEQNSWREAGDNRWERMYEPAADADSGQRERQLQREQSLSESLHEQVDRQPMSADHRPLAHALIDSLEDDGYFHASISELASALKTNPEILADVLENTVQQLEPAGVGARSLIECLLLQLDDIDTTDVLVRRLPLEWFRLRMLMPKPFQR